MKEKVGESNPTGLVIKARKQRRIPALLFLAALQLLAAAMLGVGVGEIGAAGSLIILLQRPTEPVPKQVEK